MTPLLVAASAANRTSAADLLAGHSALVVVAPHPDDETLGCGALLYEANAAGMPCRVICMTDGSASHPRSRVWPRARLAGLRRAELESALSLLASHAEVFWMGYPDCHLPEPGADDACAGRLAALIPDGALVLAAWSGDPHIDHKRSAALLTRALRHRPRTARLAYPIWGRFAPGEAPPGMKVLDPAPDARAAKSRALGQHASQMYPLIGDDPDGFVMTKADQAHFLDHPEIFHAGP
ncbi:GlcNAc-PI de-N-acetylase [Roseivivax halodurans JCM 10272]|uniref:GlcNAc-PI de-N-acetylase n=1 Tax=Roseivivax halodurans JCM 10272 TaxID=1449350 RepID=X7EMG5_9RHOB|nr:PIG-L family deacetylase [Roseivivax halodurans]ETX16338.1 GlcNAc-PI de-N-acetylase [Roseivivax halodurans JCM 10272]